MGETTIAVIGAGNGGSAIAAYLSSMQVRVRLCDLFPEYLDGIIKAGGIELVQDEKHSHCTFEMITCDVKEAIKGVHLIMVVTPSFTHKMIAETCSHSLSDGQVVVLNPGRTGGALEFMQVLHSNGCKADVTVAETQTLIYSCRKTGEAKVEIYGTKHEVTLAAIPCERTQTVLDILTPFYPQFIPAKNCLETSLSNIGALFHPAPVLMNIGRIESDPDSFPYYRDGISPSVAVLIKAIDKERIAVAKAFGVTIHSAEEWLHRAYRVTGNNLYELIQNNHAYGDILAPKTIHVRYVTEDVPMGLVPISELAKIVDIPTPNIDAVIQLASSIYKTDFRQEGRNLRHLNLEDVKMEQVIHCFETGKVFK